MCYRGDCMKDSSLNFGFIHGWQGTRLLRQFGNYSFAVESETLGWDIIDLRFYPADKLLNLGADFLFTVDTELEVETV